MKYKTTTAYRNAVGRGHVLDMAPGARVARIPARTSSRPPRAYARSHRQATPTLHAAETSKVVSQSISSQPAGSSTVAQYPLPVYQAPPRLPLMVGRPSFVRGVKRVAVGMLAAIFLVSGFVTWRGYAAANRVLAGSTTVAALASKKVSPSALENEGDGRVNIALLGIGGAGHSGGDLTDTIIIMSIDPVNRTATMVSVPRDLWIKMPNDYYGTYQKINAAYSAGKNSFAKSAGAKNNETAAINAGFETFDTAISQVLGIRVDYHVLINFKAFKEAVDSVGGVTVNVASNLIDPTMAWENGNNSVLAAAGEQHMDGKQALLYARSRHTSSDFARSERQRQLILAVKEKLLTFGTLSDPTKLDSLMKAFGDNVHTDVSTTAALRLYSIVKNISDSTITSLDLASNAHRLVTTDHVGTISVVRPTLGYNTYSGIQAYVRPYMRDGYLVKESAPLAVIAPTQTRADELTQTLTRLGYATMAGTVISSESHSSVNLAGDVTLIDLSGSTAPYTRHYLEKRYQVSATTKVPAGLHVPSGAKFVILLAK